MDEIAHCHGIPAIDWFNMLGNVIVQLSKPERRRDLGLAKIISDPRRLCDDPDCNRLNRREPNSPHVVARYEIMKDLPRVQLILGENPKERKICYGHPYEKGKYLCEYCARVAMTKRIIDGKRDGAPL
jgi:hypothetical protein